MFIQESHNHDNMALTIIINAVLLIFFGITIDNAKIFPSALSSFLNNHELLSYSLKVFVAAVLSLSVKVLGDMIIIRWKEKRGGKSSAQ